MQNAHTHGSVISLPIQDGVVGEDKPNGQAHGNGLSHDIVIPIVTHDLPSTLEEQRQCLPQQWARIRDQLRIEAGEVMFRTWFGGAFVLALHEDNVLEIGVPTKTAKRWIISHYDVRLKTLWQQENPGILRIELTVCSEAKALARAMNAAKTEETATEEPLFNDFDPEMHTLGYKAPPALPMEVFGDFWTDWLRRAATAASAPADYWALPLLTAAASCLGNARWARTKKGWKEPPALWTCSLGLSGSRKSIGVTLVKSVLLHLEQELEPGFKERHAEWVTASEVSRQALEHWQKTVATATKAGLKPPHRPAEVTDEPEPQAPRIVTDDITVEALKPMLALNPKGLVVMVDELESWFLAFNQYSKGSGKDRKEWLMAFQGGETGSDRKGSDGKKIGKRIKVPFFTVGVCGTTQPAYLPKFLENDNDGFSGRMLWAWPRAVIYQHDTPVYDDEPEKEALRDCLRRLRRLSMIEEQNGELKPVFLLLNDDADRVLGKWLEEHERSLPAFDSEQIHAFWKKMNGKVLRLALVLEHLWWATPAQPDEQATEMERLKALTPPTRISLKAVQAALKLVEDYFWPMTKLAYGADCLSMNDRNAQLIAEYLVRERPAEINARDIQRTIRRKTLQAAHQVQIALELLVDGGWLTEKPTPFRLQGGRRRADFFVNLKLINQHFPP